MRYGPLPHWLKLMRPSNPSSTAVSISRPNNEAHCPSVCGLDFGDFSLQAAKNKQKLTRIKKIFKRFIIVIFNISPITIEHNDMIINVLYQASNEVSLFFLQRQVNKPHF